MSPYELKDIVGTLTVLDQTPLAELGGQSVVQSVFPRAYDAGFRLANQAALLGDELKAATLSGGQFFHLIQNLFSILYRSVGDERGLVVSAKSIQDAERLLVFGRGDGGAD
jgi:hypothetical protein